MYPALSLWKPKFESNDCRYKTTFRRIAITKENFSTDKLLALLAWKIRQLSFHVSN